MIATYYKIFRDTLPNTISFILLSGLLSILALLLGNWLIFSIPLIFFVILSLIYGENFLLAFILVTLFTLVGDLGDSLRTIVHLFDFSLLVFLFIRKFGIDFKNYPKVPKSILYFTTLYFSVMIISSIVSAFPFAGKGIIAQQFAFLIIAYVFYSLINDESQIKIYFYSIIIVGCILSTAAIIYFYSHGFDLLDIISKNRIRVSALISNAEAASNFYVIAYPILICSLLIKKTVNARKVIWFILFYITLGLILTMSRSAIIGIVVSTLIIFYLLSRKLFYKLILTLIFLGLIFVFYEPLNNTLTLLLRIEEGMSTRDYIWSMSINMIKDYPFFGVGPGVYKYEMFNYFPFLLDNWYGKLYIYYYEVTGGANLSHNIFLVFFTEMGVLGFITIITLPIIYFNIGVKTLRKYKYQNQEKYFFIVALFAGGISIIVRNFFNSIGLLYVGGLYTDLPFWLIFGSLVYFNRVANSLAISKNIQV